MTLEVLPIGVKCNLGCQYCADPSTPVLLRDSSWKSLGALSIGDRLWSFDEHAHGGKHRKVTAGEVARTYAFKGPALRVVHEHGDLLLGANHLLLNALGRWTTAARLKPGSVIRHIASPSATPAETDAYRMGYIAGLFDGDGSLGVYLEAARPYFQWAAQVVMNDTEALSRLKTYAPIVGLSFGDFIHTSNGNILKGRVMRPAKSPGVRTRRRAIVARLARWLAEPRDDREWIRGWLAGMYDAEGSYSDIVRIAQNPGPKRDRIVRAFALLGFKASEEERGVRLLGGHGETLRLFATLRPAITRKIDFTGRSFHGLSRVLAVEDVGLRDLADISVNGQPTYYAAGVPSHNCYEEPMRQAGSFGPKYDLAAMKSTLAREGVEFTVFGGEPLLVPLADLEDLWRFGYERYHKNGVQTNGVLISDAHIAAFRRWNVYVGVSIDGPGELNDMRRAGTLQATREATEKSCANLERLLAEGIGCSLIVTIYKTNASAARLPQLLDWLRNLTAKGLRSIRVHTLELDWKAKTFALTDDETISALTALREMSLDTGLQIDIFTDIVALLRGQDQHVSCVWNGCDPWTTPAVQGVDGRGELTNCGRTNKDGHDWRKASDRSQVRQLVLYETPYEDGGCQGCRFFVACKGSCPGTSIDGDWRNRPTDCKVWMGLFEAAERDLIRVGETPVSRRADLPLIEAAMLREWEAGRPVQVWRGIELATVAPSQRQDTPQNGHSDSPHGDQHGDHWDSASA